MIRWFMLAATLAGFGFVFTTRSPALLGVGLLLGVGGFIGFVLALAADRVSANSRPDTAMASPSELAAMRKPVARAPTARPPSPPAATRPPGPKPPG
ncbi:hypothetical protein [Dokdonella sp.]|uniref:hypothetical protein n=1 Tax=Dokdonella sp. TaxID=2291710 RepID=UPI002F3FC497